MLITNLKTTENKKVEVFVHFSTIMKLDSMPALSLQLYLAAGGACMKLVDFSHL